MSGRTDWFRDHMRQVHMDFHMPEFPREAIRNFEATEFAEHLLRGKVNMVALFAKCHFGNAFYNTAAGHKHSGLPNDFLGEAVEACRRRGIRTLAYYSLCCDVRAYTRYPHWRARHADGTPLQRNGPWGPVCINTPYREELVLPQLEEIAGAYPVDGFFIDIPMVAECFCDYCREKFETMFGRALTPDVPKVERDAFLYNSTGRVLRELRAICDRHNGELVIVTNRSGRLDAPLSFRELNDIGVWESQPHSNYLSHSFATRAVRTQEQPVQVMSVRFYQGWGDLTLKPSAQMTTEFAAMIGNGGVAVSGDQVQVDGTLQPAVYEMFNQAFGFVEARESLLRDASSVADTALVAPVPRRDWPAPNAVGPEMMGAHKALLESHVPFDIITSLDLGQLANYDTLVLTEPCEFDAAFFPALRDWVHAGGTLVAVGTSLLRGHNCFELQDVFGIDYLEPSVFSVSHFVPRPAVAGATADLPLQCRGRSLKVVPAGADTLADYIYPQIESTAEYSFRHRACPPPAIQASPYPFATVHAYGGGRAVYIAGSIFRIYWETNHHWLRQFVEGLWRYLHPDPLFEVDASGVIEANLMTKPDGVKLLNLIHYQVGHQGHRNAIPSIERVHPIHHIHCRVKAPHVSSVRLEPEGREIPFEQHGDVVAFSVPEIEYLAVVRIA